MRLKETTFEDLKKPDMLLIVSNDGEAFDRVFFQIQTEKHLTVHRFVQDDYITFNKSSIIELNKYSD